ncbi:MAG TPA: DUF1707 domain-containing protein [Natronosporangium sp.]|nr:DUF1707 domain-containing protein [Natronosporangium sp.]
MTDPFAPSPPPGSPGGWRPSDSDRQRVADRLRQAVDEGRLDLHEYDQRLRASEQAPTMAALERVVADLPAAPEAVLAQIGEITITENTVHTPAGPIPLHGSQWMVQDQWMATQKIPTWAIVLAIVGFFCLTIFSLLFLLAKETIYRGHVQVTVSNGAQQYVTYVPVQSYAQVQYVHQQVNYARSLAAR